MKVPRLFAAIGALSDPGGRVTKPFQFSVQE
jgi:hypothetical protein